MKTFALSYAPLIICCALLLLILALVIVAGGNHAVQFIADEITPVH